jgi:hypothetical protein
MTAASHDNNDNDKNEDEQQQQQQQNQGQSTDCSYASEAEANVDTEKGKRFCQEDASPPNDNAFDEDSQRCDGQAVQTLLLRLLQNTSQSTTIFPDQEPTTATSETLPQLNNPHHTHPLPHHPPTPMPPGSPRPDLPSLHPMQLRVIAAVMTHLFSAWRSTFPHTPPHDASQRRPVALPRVHPETLPYCAACLVSVLSTFLQTLLTDAHTYLKRIHRAMLKATSDVATTTMMTHLSSSSSSSSFFYRLVPLAIECCCLSPLNESFALTLLPRLLPMLKLLDEITYNIRRHVSIAPLSGSSVGLEWLDDFECSCAIMTSRYACMLITTTTVSRTIGTDKTDDNDDNKDSVIEDIHQ